MSQSSVPTEQIFKQLCLSLRNTDPKLWEQFVQCFDVYTIEVQTQMVKAPDTELLRMQGRAQQCMALLRIFAECHIQKRPPQQPTAAPPNGDWQGP